MRLLVRCTLLSLAGVLSPLAFAQQAGHNTVPTTGPAARGGFATAPRPDDPVLLRVEQLRHDLADAAKLYKKMKGPERAERQPEWMAALARAQAEVAALKAP